jgi:hypothetical protein
MRRLSVSAWLLVAATAVLLCEGAYASAATRWVNDDASSYNPPGMSCRIAGYATIQAAVSAANAGDTIKVCPGTYAETVTIPTNNLKILSTGGAANTIIAPSTHNIVVEIEATGLTLKGFTIVPAGFTDPDIGINVALQVDTGVAIKRNVVRGGRIGINLGCVSFGTTIKRNDVVSQTEAGINIDTCEAPPFPGSHNNSIHHNTACSVTSTASIALGGSSDDNDIHHNTATTISSFGSGNEIHDNTTRNPIVDNSGGANSIHDNTVNPNVCF